MIDIYKPDEVRNLNERPIVFSGSMVQAILDGRKTQTRRILKRQPNNDPSKHHPIEPYLTSRGTWNWVLANHGMGCGDPFPCPYGVAGDRLWVRETWAREKDKANRTVCYKADGTWGSWSEDAKFYQHGFVIGVANHRRDGRWVGRDYFGRFKPSKHMPRWASRLVLEIKLIRVERLQDISEEDLKAEMDWSRVSIPDDSDPWGVFATLWESINGADSWAQNPWVWVIDFERVTDERNHV